MADLRSRSDKFFLCKVAMPEMQEDGNEKNVTKQYAINALDWAEAQMRITEHLTPYAKNGMEIKDIRPAKFTEIFFTDRSEDDAWYSAKLAYITIDERSGKEKKKIHTHLFQAKSLDDANRIIGEAMSGTMIDYNKTAINDSNIFEVVEYK